MAEVIKNKLGIESELIKSSGGVFEITSENRLIFSKKEQGRFPTEDEVLESISRLST